MGLPLAGAKAKAADWSAVFPQGVDALPDYVPTLTQGATVTKTITSANYMRIGRWVVGETTVVCTSTGTASNAILLGLPVPAVAVGQNIGDVFLFDASVPLGYTGVLVTNGSVASIFIDGTNGAFAGATGSGFTAALTTNDQLRARFAYEAAS